jgi:hypothetical protein
VSSGEADTQAVKQVVITSVAPPNLGPTQTYTATAVAYAFFNEDGDGHEFIVLAGETVRWFSSNPNVFTVNGSGLVTGVAAGQADLIADVDGYRDRQTITITNPQNPADSVQIIGGGDINLTVGSTATREARVLDINGNVLVNQTMGWVVADPTKATASADSGDENHRTTLAGVAAGSTTLRAQSGSILSPISNLIVTAASGRVFFATKFDSGNKSQNVNGWRFSGIGQPVVSSIPAGLSDTTHGMLFAFGPSSSNREQRMIYGENVTGLYFGFRLFIDEFYFHRNGPSTDNNKFWRSWSGRQDDGNQGYADYQVKGGFSTDTHTSGGIITGNSRMRCEFGQSNSSCAPGGVGQNGTPHTASLFSAGANRWYHVMGRLQLSSVVGASDGILQLWIDGVNRASHTNLAWYSRCVGSEFKHYFSNGYLLGAANSGWDVATNTIITRLRIADTFDLADPDRTDGWTP